MAKFDGLLIGQYKKNAGGIKLTGIACSILKTGYSSFSLAAMA